MIKPKVLANGVRVLLNPMKGTETVTVLVGVGVGSRYETKSINGISHFLEHMTFKGTRRRPGAFEIAAALDGVGGEYNAFTHREYTFYYVKLPAPHLELALDIEADVLINSLFNAREISREKGVVIEEINMVQDDPPRHLGDVFEELLYGDQPAGWNNAGTKETVAALNRQKLVRFFKKHYVGSNLVLTVTGRFNPRDWQRLGRPFQAVARGQKKSKKAVLEEQTRPQLRPIIKATDQTHLSIGVRGYDLFHPDRYAFTVLAALLGSGMSSRMWMSVREQKGLAYYVFTDAQTYTDTGYLTTQAGVNNEKVAAAFEAVLAEYRKLREKKVSPSELTKAKESIKGRFLMGLENSAQLASFLTLQLLLTGKALTPQEKLAKIDAVTTDDIRRVARDIFKPAKLNAALIGPRPDPEPILKKLNQALT